MIKSHSSVEDVGSAAAQAERLISEALNSLPPVDHFDYGGHDIKLDEYNMCLQCTKPIAEAQQASNALKSLVDKSEDQAVKEHLEVAAELLFHEAEAAKLRAMLHNGNQSEPIVNRLLGHIHNKQISDNYSHSHQQAEKS